MTLLTTIFSFFITYGSAFSLEKQLVEEYKSIRTELEKNRFAETENYYFLFGTVEVDDYEDDIEFFAEANAYENLEVYAFNKICWPNYFDTETKVKVFYQFLKNKPLMKINKNITILKKSIKPNNFINFIFTFNKKNNKINFPNSKDLGFINICN